MFLFSPAFQALLGPGLYTRHEQAHDGVLQRFVESREPCDCLIRAIWTPRSAVYEKRVNKWGGMGLCTKMIFVLSSFCNFKTNENIKYISYVGSLFNSLPLLPRNRLLHQDHVPVNVPVQDRIASFDTSLYHQDSSQIPGGALKTRLEAQCASVVSHLR